MFPKSLVVIEGLWTAGKDFVRPWVTADLTASLTFTKAWKKTSFMNGVNKGCHPRDSGVRPEQSTKACLRR